MESVENKRDSNLELYRILLMLFIIGHHYVVNSGLTDHIALVPLATRSLFYLVFGAWGKAGINCFVMITGYFMCKSNITLRKFLKLILEVEFYHVIIYIIFVFTGYEALTVGNIIRVAVPIRSVSDGFTSSFLLFYLLIPFVNILIKNMSEKQHIILIGLLLFIYSVLGCFFPANVKMNYVSWFIVIYIIAAYIRCYPEKIKILSDHAGIKMLTVLLLACFSVVFMTYLGNWQGVGSAKAFFHMADCNKPIALAVAVESFIFFKNIKIPYNPVINKIASATFGVFMIHTNSDAMRTWLWQDLLRNTEVFYLPKLIIPHAVLSVLGVFVVCMLIDLIRIRWIEKPIFKYIDRLNIENMFRKRKCSES